MIVRVMTMNALAVLGLLSPSYTQVRPALVYLGLISKGCWFVATLGARGCLLLAGLMVPAGAQAMGFCGGFDLGGPVEQCLSDDNGRNGCYNIWGNANSCWEVVDQSQCCGHGHCVGCAPS